jgi:hypothetical protein
MPCTALGIAEKTIEMKSDPFPASALQITLSFWLVAPINKMHLILTCGATGGQNETGLHLHSRAEVAMCGQRLSRMNS